MGWETQFFEKNRLKSLSVGKRRCLAKSLKTNVQRSPHAARHRFKQTADSGWLFCFLKNLCVKVLQLKAK